MKKITQDNLVDFAPVTGDYAKRLDGYIRTVGLESEITQKEYGAAMRKLNGESGIGFSEAEIKILELIYAVDERNERFNNDPHIAPGHGGNTAEHPIFMSLAFDSFKDKAGMGEKAFDPDSSESLKIARLSQRVHGMIAVHDIGEIVDISLGEVRESGANLKEPEEEKLVGPFKFKLAAHALSQGDPLYYADMIESIKNDATKAKQELFDWRMQPTDEARAEFEKTMNYGWALQGLEDENLGDRFVRAVGKVIGTKMAQAERLMGVSPDRTAYTEAGENLTGLFNEGEEKKTVAAYLMALTDQFEGSFHYTHFAGKAAKKFAEANPAANPAEAVLTRLFGDGKSEDFILSASKTMESQILYPQKSVKGAFLMVAKEPAETQEIAGKLVSAATSSILMNAAEMLRKAPPFADFSDSAKTEPGVKPSAGSAEQQEALATRLGVQRDMLASFRGRMRQEGRDRVVTTLEGVTDTKAIIAVLVKAAEKLESGEWRPDFADGATVAVPTRAPLPEALHVTRQEIKTAIEKLDGKSTVRSVIASGGFPAIARSQTLDPGLFSKAGIRIGVGR